MRGKSDGMEVAARREGARARWRRCPACDAIDDGVEDGWPSKGKANTTSLRLRAGKARLALELACGGRVAEPVYFGSLNVPVQVHVPVRLPPTPQQQHVSCHHPPTAHKRPPGRILQLCRPTPHLPQTRPRRIPGLSLVESILLLFLALRSQPRPRTLFAGPLRHSACRGRVLTA